MMLQEMKALAREKNSCVLATIVDSKPYCSLMAYVTNSACTEIYMVTHRQTQKFQNLVANPAVSLMIDTRDATPRSIAKAMTVEGIFKRNYYNNNKNQGYCRAVINPKLDKFMKKYGSKTK